MTSIIEQPNATEADKKKRRDDLLYLLLLLLDDGEPQQAWERFVAPTFAGLISGDGFTWDSATQSYKSDSGTTINGNAAQRIIVSAAHAAEIDIERKFKAAEQSGDLEAWRDSSLDELMALYVAGAAIGAGGIQNVSEKDLEETALKASSVASESLESIVDDYQAGRISLAQAVNRAGMNAQQVNGVYQEARRGSHMGAADENGVAIFTTERNVLTEGARHCSECPELTRRGWVTIGTLPLPGFRICGPNCKCHLEYGMENA